MRFLKSGAVLLGLGLCGLSPLGAVSVEIKNRFDHTPAPGLGFGGVSAVTSRHHTAGQYLELTHPDSRFRRVYVYTDNGGAFGRPQPGLVNVLLSSGTPVPPIPFYWRLYTDSVAAFDATNEGAWTPFLEKSDPAFADVTQKELRARIPMAGPGRSRLALAIKTPADVWGGDYVARLVIEELSDVTDVAGPTITHDAFLDLILTGSSFEILAAAEDDGTVVSSSVVFRMDGGSWTFRTAVLEADPGNPFRWVLRAPFFPADVHAGTLDYYFIVRDAFDNATKSQHYSANLLGRESPIERAADLSGGVLRFSVTDPSDPGVELRLSSLSLAAPVTIGVRLMSEDRYPPVEGHAPVRVFDFSPDGLRFAESPMLVLPYPDRDQDGRVDTTGDDETTLRIFWFDRGRWRHVGGVVDPAANQVRAPVSHFSVYALAPLTQSLSAALVRPLERIFTPNGDGHNDTAIFNLAPGDFAIEIFDVRARLVRRLSGVNEWDGRDDSGSPVEPGTYVYRLKGPGLDVTGTLAVVR